MGGLFEGFYLKKSPNITSILAHTLTRKYSSRMHTDRNITRLSRECVAMRLIVDGQTPVKTLPSPCGQQKHDMILKDIYICWDTEIFRGGKG